MNNNTTVEKKEPVIASHWIPVQIMIPALTEQQPEEEKKPNESLAKKLIPAIILIALAWYITLGWRLFQ